MWQLLTAQAPLPPNGAAAAQQFGSLLLTRALLNHDVQKAERNQGASESLSLLRFELCEVLDESADHFHRQRIVNQVRADQVQFAETRFGVIGGDGVERRRGRLRCRREAQQSSNAQNERPRHFFHATPAF